jgi:hypothetical protein
VLVTAGTSSGHSGVECIVAQSILLAHAADAEIFAANAVEQLAGRHQAELSAQVVKIADAMLGTLTNLKA